MALKPLWSLGAALPAGVLALGALIATGAGGAAARPIGPAPADGGRLVEPVADAGARTAGLQPDGTYMLSKDELALDCKKLTGRAQIRIMQLRDYELRSHGSLAARTTQKLVVPLFGGSTYGADPEADYRRDRAILEAYNRRLAEKKCRVFDLVKELQPRPAAETPLPRRP